MAIEVEHKFLLLNDDWRQAVSHSVYYRQGHLTRAADNCSIRIRVSDDQAWLNIKSADIGVQRHEYEYKIPLQEAHEMLDNLCHKPLIEKKRHFVNYAGHVWEIDEFEAENKGLIVAEIELSSAGEFFAKPPWIGQEVTRDLRYYNNNLASKPYKTWTET